MGFQKSLKDLMGKALWEVLVVVFGVVVLSSWQTHQLVAEGRLVDLVAEGRLVDLPGLLCQAASAQVPYHHPLCLQWE